MLQYLLLSYRYVLQPARAITHLVYDWSSGSK